MARLAELKALVALAEAEEDFLAAKASGKRGKDYQAAKARFGKLRTEQREARQAQQAANGVPDGVAVAKPVAATARKGKPS